jgi:hypothetical protein
MTLLAGCETTVAVTGLLGDSEALSGSLTHYDDGGTIELYGAPGTHCVGNIQYRRSRDSRSDGDGVLVCDDRRSGPFTFTLDGPNHGSGSGILSGQRYRFSF